MERGRGKRKDVCGLGGKERILIEMARQEWEGRGGEYPSTTVLASPLFARYNRYMGDNGRVGTRKYQC